MTVIHEPARVGPVARRLLALLVATVPLGVLLLSAAVWWQRLPDPMPTHWGRQGHVDDTTSLTGFLIGMAVTAGVGGCVALLGTVGRGIGRRARRWLLFTGAAVSAFAAGLWLTTASLALDLADPRLAAAPTWQIPAMLAATLLFGVVAFALGPAPPPPPPATSVPAADLPRAETTRIEATAPGTPLWQETITTHVAVLLLPAFLAVLAVVLAVVLNPWVATPLLAALALTLVMVTYRLVVDQDGLRVGLGPWRWPWVTVKLSEVESAAVTRVQAAEWGGWGYRLRSGGDRALIGRSGPAVELRLSAGRRFVTSTRSPETVAGLLNALIDRQGRQ